MINILFEILIDDRTEVPTPRDLVTFDRFVSQRNVFTDSIPLARSVCRLPLFQNESWCTTGNGNVFYFHVYFIVWQIKLISK